MSLSVQPLEFVYSLINVVAFVFTLSALFDARSDRAAARLLKGSAVELAAHGIVRREVIRLIVQGILLSFVIPGLFSDREVTLNQFSVGLIAISLFLLFQTALDARERKALTAAVAADALVLQDSWGQKLSRQIAENTIISQAAREDAQEAASIANHMNAKLFRQQEAGLAQGKERDAEAVILSETIDTTAQQVADLHEGTAPGKPA